MDMIPKEAIEKAVEGGWRGVITTKQTWENIALDPSFWQALGKALGWSDTRKSNYDFLGKPHVREEMQPSPDWTRNALRFYDLILTEGDTKAFWGELLSVPHKHR